MAPVKIPSIPKDPRKAAGRLAITVAEANDRLTRSQEWYAELYASYKVPIKK